MNVVILRITLISSDHVAAAEISRLNYRMFTHPIDLNTIVCQTGKISEINHEKTSRLRLIQSLMVQHGECVSSDWLGYLAFFFMALIVRGYCQWCRETERERLDKGCLGRGG